MFFAGDLVEDIPFFNFDYPDEKAVFLSPSCTLSVLEDLDLNVFTQLFLGSNDSAFSNAGNVVAGSLKWNL